MRFLRAALAGLVLSIPVAAADAIPTVATVGGNCSATWYYNSDGWAYRLFTTCPPGTRYYAQRAKIICNNGVRYGVWQTQPGPWYGSTASCPPGGHVSQISYVEFW